MCFIYCFNEIPMLYDIFVTNANNYFYQIVTFSITNKTFSSVSEKRKRRKSLFFY